MRMQGNVSLATLVQSLNHGFRTLPLLNWTRASGIGVSLGIVGAILALRDGKMAMLTGFPWSFGRANHSEKSLSVPGLQNLHSNCFLNVVLQALASCVCFQTFLHSVIQECGIEDLVERMPLTVSLTDLLEELSLISTEKVVLSPRKVMLTMAHYIPNFNLTRQQDAAEAFLHLLCSLREEFRDSYTPNTRSLVDLFASNHRIITPMQRNWQSEQERWQQHVIGPFDGILGSILTCQTCSSQISITFESFDCLPLSPLLKRHCTLVDCLKQFVIAEHVENYHCSHCWHNAAIKYLSLTNANETEIEKLRRCSDQELCDCQTIYGLDKLPWSNRFSHTLKQLSIARCPRILCLHLKRVSMNEFGEPVKLQDHVSFPLILDVSPFITTRMGRKIQEVDVQRLDNKSNPLPNHYNLPYERRMLNDIYGTGRENASLCHIDDGLGSENAESLGDTMRAQSTASPSGSIHIDTQTQPTDKVDPSCDSISQETCLYQLVSVVEHFGIAGGGHYTVYRRVIVESSQGISDNQGNPTPMQWFCVSDSQVHPVSEEHVLSAEASLLFYERIPNS
ncbi:hypothetical protein L6164_012301 [Bauhinia variegata]|uniref:Uncharacterized protein n=1 Tax=Bauhinia variegata TaxID=167791 RepID=A0ACB9P8M8_BAUVA|nr:hypothetical protein L6164_012301 [Bauhinia variegata]